MVFGHPVPSPKEHYDEDTLFKVMDALREDAGLTEKQTRKCIDAMRAKGILFREKIAPVVPTGPVPREASWGVAHHVGSSDVVSNPS